ncbi:hypothetical protein [Ruegeria marisrubri]|nr:hypothetical protein [Ruegeria marisrubri]
MTEAVLGLIASFGLGLLLHARSRARAIRQRREGAGDAFMRLVLTRHDD